MKISTNSNLAKNKPNWIDFNAGALVEGVEMKTQEDNEQFEKNYRASINNNHQAAPDDDRTIWRSMV